MVLWGFFLSLQICSRFLGANHDCSTLPQPPLSHCEPWNLIEVLKIVSVLSDWSWIIKHLQLECELLLCWWWKNHSRIQFILVLFGLWWKKITWEKKVDEVSITNIFFKKGIFFSRYILYPLIIPSHIFQSPLHNSAVHCKGSKNEICKLLERVYKFLI